MRILVHLAFASLISACSAHGSPPPPAPGSDLSSVAGYCEARAAAECNATVVKSCGATDKTKCSDARKATCASQVPQGTTYLASRAPACIGAVTDAYADGAIDVDDERSIGDACGPSLFSGPGAARAPCTVAYDCSSADELTCVVPRGATSGKCLKPNAVAAGAACPGEADACPSGFYCDTKSITCKTTAVVGETCDAMLRPCAPGLTCNGGPFGSGCTMKGGKGEPCSSDTDCGAAICDKAVGQTEGTCTERITLSSFDAACATFK